ncbi:Glycosyltransferase involved in cell wall bisynthesis [Succiniclasticum ruminis]|uniref:Glycosyltransferase involved in cell wall bisynthesis n=1 Tax=Succiniclasticum ruminis TaxID=40841 RepID=A0A1G6HRT7_9FIRM|nr:glycosyltransferase family 4 protein [Succiniclasticum ruminis]SDB96858.1 Glycosyltransferase involved in cell wall bisynthesis [Succiniclasticum ruminis]
MNILFLSLIDIENLDERSIYTDLLREFWKHDHNVYVISPIERRKKKQATLLHTEKAVILKPKILNMQKTGNIEKGFSMLTIESIILKAVKKYFADVKFDLVLYATPPVTFHRVVSYVKKRDNAVTYLLQKDIFPEGALDLGVLSKTGWKGLVYKYFRYKEMELLKVSDHIGCMSVANVQYIRNHNSFIAPDRVELCPNSIEVIDKSVMPETRVMVRKKYNIPLQKKVFIYGGNLGKPQGIPFLVSCLEKAKEIEKAFFVIVGDGTDFGLIENYVKHANQQNLKLMKHLPKEDYETLVGACDVGMIFLDHRFTIPNFPSRLLSYMQAKIPVLAVTDPYTDIGNVIVKGGFGWWCESDDTDSFVMLVASIVNEEVTGLGKNGYEYLKDYYNVHNSYAVIAKAV